MSLNPAELQSQNFQNTYKLLNEKIKKCKSDPVKEDFYKGIKKKVEKAEEKLKSLIAKTKEIKMKPAEGATEGVSFYDKFIAGKEKLVSLMWLSDKVGAELNSENIDSEKTTTVKLSDFNAEGEEINTKRDFIDKTKSVVHQFTHGTGFAKFLMNGCLAVGIGEVLTKGVTSYLAKEGIVESSMGLFGLADLGIKNASTLWGFLETGFSVVTGFSTLALGVGAGLLVLKGIPMIRGLVDKIKAKHKEANSLETGIEKMMQEQQAKQMS